MMSNGEGPHLTQEQFLDLYYDGGSDPHLERCAECKAEYRTWQQLLNTVEAGAMVPERGPEYGAEVWSKLAPRLDLPVAPRQRKSSSWWSARWLPVAGMALLVIGAFLAGRYTRPVVISNSPVVAAKADPSLRERVLMVSVGDFLERSQIVLAELANAPDHRPLSIASEQERAEDLLQENRLYRQTANATGDQNVAAVLDELERVLLTIAHSPATLSGPQLQDLQQRLEDQGVLFKLRVLGSHVQQREQQLGKQQQQSKQL